MVFHKSLTKELTFTALGVFIVLLSIIISTQTINMLGRAAEGQIANEAVTALIGFWALGFFPLLMILTVFVSVMIVLTRLWRDHEMSVWLSSGLSLNNWVWPILRFSLPMAILVAIVTMYVGPWADQRSQTYADIIKQREELTAIAPGVFKESATSSKVYFIEDYSGAHGSATNVFMQDVSDGKVATIFAKHGYITTNKDGERLLVLETGKRYVGTPGQSDYEQATFQKYSVIIDQNQKLGKEAHNRQSIPTAELWGNPDPNFRSELVWRLSMPISCIVLALLALPLSYFNPRSGHTYNLLFALLAFFIYENGLTLVRNWISQGKVNMFSMFVVHLIFTGIALLLLKHRNKPATTLSQTFAHLFRKS